MTPGEGLSVASGLFPTDRPGDAVIGSPALLGRRTELGQLVSLLGRPDLSLINVTGPRGTGKSSLVSAAVQVSGQRFASLDQLDLGDGSPADAVRLLSARLGRLATLRRRVDCEDGRQRVLLVIPDADALVPVSVRAAQLLIGHRGVTVLAESCARLRAPGWGSLEIGPLPPSDATALFRVTANSLGVPLPDDGATTATIDRICSSLRGNPLAVELAATRLQRLPLADLARMLADPGAALSVLLPPGEGQADRYRRALLADFHSLSAGAQRLLDRLPVFGGAFSLQAAEAVSEAEGEPCHESLGQLVDRRLVEFDPDESGHRYRLAGLGRGFAGERFASSPSATAAQAGHASYYSSLARRAAAAFDDADEDLARTLLGDDYDEALVAVHWLSSHDPVRGVQLLVDLAWEGHRRGQGPLLAGLINQRLTVLTDEARAVRRDALLWWVQLQSWAPGSADRSEVIGQRLAEGLELARELDEPLPLLRALRSRYVAVAAVGDVDGAMDACVEGIRIASRYGHARWIARFEISLSSMHHLLRQFETAAPLAGSGLSRAIRAGDRRAIVRGTLVLQGLPAEYREGMASVPTLEAALDLARQVGDQQSETHVLTMLAYQAVEREDVEGACSWLLARQHHLGRSDLLHGLTVSVMLGVLIGRLRGDLRTSARLHGAISSHVEQLAAVLHPDHVAHYKSVILALRDGLGQQEFEIETAVGRLQTREQALTALLTYLNVAHASPPPAADTADSVPPKSLPEGAPPLLTPREVRVLALLAQGLRNKEIADELGIASKTVMHHTSAIYRKLAVRGRSGAVVTAARLGLVSL